jgi:benzodiazapine receptor
MKLNNFLKLVIAIVVSQLAGIIGSVFTVSSIPTWYAMLQKPSFSPPNWIFGPVWTTLYFLMGVAAFLVWSSYSKATDGQTQKRIKVALWVFIGQLILNALWSVIFFGLKNPGWAFVEIILLWLAIVGTIIVFSKISRLAVFLLLPYILWVSFAGYLNYSIWMFNQEEPVACTMDVKQCPDGSYVGRVPPNCDFAPCPKEDLIQVETPKANEIISSPLIIKGKARGSWFFEADFPIVLTDWDGRIIAESYATAQGEWMTEDFVPFEGLLEFEKPEIIGEFAKRGTLILQKDNPSGLPEYDDALEFTIFFEQ